MSILTDLLKGRAAHKAPLACIEDLPWELSGRRVTHLPHTIWQLLGHLNYWMDLELRSIEGPEAPYPDTFASSWPNADGPTDETAWLTEIALFRTNLGQLITLADAQASTLARIVHPKTGTTVEAVIAILASHNSYHLGQIVTLRQALGNWR